jgi:hypothetical protein
MDRKITKDIKMEFTISITCKDNRYKYVIDVTNITETVAAGTAHYERTDATRQKLDELITLKYDETIADLKDVIKNHMNKPLESSSDW